MVLAPDDERWATHDWSAFGDRLAPLWCGGATRRDSVLNGLIAMANVVDPDDWVLVHDAARPCLAREELVERLIDERAATTTSAGSWRCRSPTRSSARTTTSASRRPSRATSLWLAQTPQMFRHGTLLRGARRRRRDVTDEASAVEALGLRPRLVPGSARNIKVTFAGRRSRSPEASARRGDR